MCSSEAKQQSKREKRTEGSNTRSLQKMTIKRTGWGGKGSVLCRFQKIDQEFRLPVPMHRNEGKLFVGS